MADVKISALPAVTTVVPGTDVAPLVSGGVTTKATPQQMVNAALAAPAAIGSGTPADGTFAKLQANDTFTSSTVKAPGSGGGTLISNSGTNCFQWGGGGGSNCTFDGGFSANAANVTISLQPTGTGVVTIKPTATGTMDNMQIGVTDPDLAFFNNSVNLNGADTTNAVRGFFVSNDNTDTTNPQLRISARDDINSIWIDYSTVAGGAAATLAFSNGGNYQWLMTQGGDLAPKAGSAAMKEGFVYSPGGDGAPTDTPTNESGGVTPLYFDETNTRLYAYNSGWQYVSMAPSYITTEAGTSRTLTAADNNKVIYCTSGSAVTITTASGLGANFNCSIIQGGAGKVTVAQGASTTLVSYSSLFSTMGQFAVISLITPVADTFVAAGNLGV